MAFHIVQEQAMKIAIMQPRASTPSEADELRRSMATLQSKGPCYKN